MSAEEFGQWQCMYTAEAWHPADQRLRHARLLAAAHNGALVKADKTLWRAADLLPPDPWAPPPAEPTTSTADLAAQVDRINRLMD